MSLQKTLIPVAFLVTFLTGFLLPYADASAQNADFGALKAIAGDSRLTLRYSFSCKSPKGDFSGTGSVIYQEGAYVFKSDGLKLYDDSRTRWMVNSVSKEAVAEPSDQVDKLKDMSSLLKVFGINPKGAVITVLNGKDGRPAGIKASLKDGTESRILFTGIELSPKGSLSDFNFDPSTLDSSWVVTDLR